MGLNITISPAAISDKDINVAITIKHILSGLLSEPFITYFTNY